MAKAVRTLKQRGVAGVTTYTLVLKRSSRFIPSLWGVMVNDHDRAYFLLEHTPNNRLTTHLSERNPFLHLRLLAEADTKLTPVKCGVRSLDRATWGDRWYNMASCGHDQHTYLLETSKGVVGYLTVHGEHPDCRVIDEVAVGKQHKGEGHGGVLLRFADTLARHRDCRCVQLNAIKEQYSWYKKNGYKLLPGRKPILLDGEEYSPMERVLLYHLPQVSA